MLKSAGVSYLNHTDC